MPHETLAAPSHNKLYGIEIIRFICAIAILIWHYQHFSFVADLPTNFIRKQQPFFPVLKIFYVYGLYGVEVFWCISGFIFFWKYREAVSAGAVNAKTFFVRRFSRLYPLHFTTLLLVAMLQLAYFHLHGFFFVYRDNDLHHFFLQLFMASNWSITSTSSSFNGPIWSISVEVLVYFFFFLVARCAGKSALISCVIIGLCILARETGPPRLILECAGFFYAGGLAAIAGKIPLRNKQRSILSALAWFAVCAAPLALREYTFDDMDSFMYWFLMAYTPIVLFCMAHTTIRNPALQKPMEIAGNLTYSSYLVHFPLQLSIALVYTLTGAPIPFYEPWFFLAFMTMTLVISYFVYRYFEAPMRSAIRQILA